MKKEKIIVYKAQATAIIIFVGIYSLFVNIIIPLAIIGAIYSLFVILMLLFETPLDKWLDKRIEKRKGEYLMKQETIIKIAINEFTDEKWLIAVNGDDIIAKYKLEADNNGIINLANSGIEIIYLAGKKENN